MKKWFAPSKPGEIKPIPWLHKDAISYLENLLTPDMNVLEFGAGGSTLWFAERVKSVMAFEDNFDWGGIVKKQAPANVRVFTTKGRDLLIDSPQVFDLLLIDGEPVEQRAEWLKVAPRLVKPGGYVVLDNANRREYAGAREEFAKHATLLHTVDGNEPPCVNLITEFWRLK